MQCLRRRRRGSRCRGNRAGGALHVIRRVWSSDSTAMPNAPSAATIRRVSSLIKAASIVDRPAPSRPQQGAVRNALRAGNFDRRGEREGNGSDFDFVGFGVTKLELISPHRGRATLEGGAGFARTSQTLTPSKRRS